MLVPTPHPAETAVPGWRDAAAAYYLAMEALGGTLLRSVARGLGLPELIFDPYFRNGISTLRLTRYPLRDASASVDLSSPEFSVVHK